MTRLPELRATRFALVTLAALALAACATHSAAPAAVPAPIRLTGTFAPNSTHAEVLTARVTHTELRIPSGPWLVHVVEVAPNSCGVELHTVKGLDHMVG